MSLCLLQYSQQNIKYSERMDYLCGSVLISVSHIKMLCLVSGLLKKRTFTILSDEKNMPPDGICSKREPKSFSVRAQPFFIRVSFTL